MSKSRQLNKDLPDWVVEKYKIKKILQEYGELQSEVAYLKYELEQKNKAINAFKKWQRRSAEYNYQYWLHEGIKLLEEQPEEREFKALFQLMNGWELFKSRFKTILGNIKNMEEARTTLLAMIQEEEEKIKNSNSTND